jgi:hypothetical protein
LSDILGTSVVGGFEDLIDRDGLSSDEEARLRHVHDLLVMAGPPPDLPPALERPPSAPPPDAEVVQFRCSTAPLGSSPSPPLASPSSSSAAGTSRGMRRRSRRRSPPGSSCPCGSTRLQSCGSLRDDAATRRCSSM